MPLIGCNAVTRHDAAISVRLPCTNTTGDEVNGVVAVNQFFAVSVRGSSATIACAKVASPVEKPVAT